MQFTTSLFLGFLVLAPSTFVCASLHLSHIQALVGFPQACTDAYNTPIDACNDAHFNNGPLCSCSSACTSALDSITNTIISACQGTSASPATLVGLFFNHAATNFLCTPPSNGGGGGCGAGTTGSSSQKSASLQASSTTTTQDSSSTQSRLSSSSMTTSTSPILSVSPSTTSTTSTTSITSTTSTTSSTTLSTPSTSRATSKVSSNQPKPTTGGGSPFDVSGNAGIKIDTRTHTLSLLLLFSAVTCFML